MSWRGTTPTNLLEPKPWFRNLLKPDVATLRLRLDPAPVTGHGPLSPFVAVSGAHIDFFFLVGIEFCDEVFTTLISNLSNPSPILRKHISSLLFSIFQVGFQPPRKSSGEPIPGDVKYYEPHLKLLASFPAGLVCHPSLFLSYPPASCPPGSLQSGLTFLLLNHNWITCLCFRRVVPMRFSDASGCFQLIFFE